MSWYDDHKPGEALDNLGNAIIMIVIAFTITLILIKCT